MKKYYVKGQEIILTPQIFNKGEEANLYLCKNFDKNGKPMLAKIFKSYRRKNLPAPSEEMYKKQITMKTESFYLPQDLIYDEEEKFSGCLLELFENEVSCTLAQTLEIKKLALQINKVYQETDIFTENNIQIHDMKKINHVLYNQKTEKLGVVDTGLFQFYVRQENEEERNLKYMNSATMGRVLRKAFLFLTKEGFYEDFCENFPKVYDLIDTDIVSLGDILLDESEKYGVATVEELKKVYKKM